MKLFFQMVSVTTALLLLGGFSCIERKPERLEKKQSPVSADLASMVAEIEELSHDSMTTKEQLVMATEAHCHEVYRLIAQALIRDPSDLYQAAWILSHADTSAGAGVCLLAHYLAVVATEKGYKPAKYLAAMCLDKHLIRINSPQLYGTQYYNDSQGVYWLYPMDSTTTDSARVAWDVPPLVTLKARLEALNAK